MTTQVNEMVTIEFSKMQIETMAMSILTDLFEGNHKDVLANIGMDRVMQAMMHFNNRNYEDMALEIQSDMVANLFEKLISNLGI